MKNSNYFLLKSTDFKNSSLNFDNVDLVFNVVKCKFVQSNFSYSNRATDLETQQGGFPEPIFPEIQSEFNKEICEIKNVFILVEI